VTLPQLQRAHREFLPLFPALTVFVALQVACVVMTNLLFDCDQEVVQPVIESVLLLDRAAYLAERDHDVCLISVFDESISPRNMALSALRPPLTFSSCFS
jgi:hypothetical protein